MSPRNFVLVGALAAALAAPAHGYHATTHAGLTERAALASALHKRLIERLGRPLGLYEPLTLDGNPREPVRARLDRRLGALDPEGGYAPDGGRQSALGWLVAGAVLEGVPAERTRNHFYDPAHGTGLDQVDGDALATRLRAVGAGVSALPGVFTGTAFDGSGRPSVEWLRAADNEWGLTRFFDEYERTAAAPTPGARDGALARALLAAGAILHLLEDAGDPTFVRDDYRVALEADAGPYERLVVLRYGRLAVPPPSGAPLVRARLGDYFHAADGNGLADRTQARFFSPGTLPSSGRFSVPVVSEYGDGDDGYSAGAVRHLVRWRHAPSGAIIWSLDERCLADYAAALLPETGRYAAGALDVLFRGALEVTASDGHARVIAHGLGLGRGTLSVYADVPGKPRARVTSLPVSGAADGAELGTAEVPAGATRLAAVFRGVDADGEPLVVVQEQAL